MSTFGRTADRIAAQKRQHERKLAEKADWLNQAIAFAIRTLASSDLPDDVARKTALDALRLGRGMRI